MQFKGALQVDATRGTFSQFVIEGRQVVFADEMFTVRNITTKEAFSQSGTSIAARGLTDAGKKLFDQLKALGGRGVILEGEPFDRYVRFTQELSMPQLCVIVRGVEACPEADPQLDPYLQDLLDKKARDEATEKEKKHQDNLRMEEDAIRLELLREEMRENMKRQRDEEKRGKKTTAV